jgi:hypothetical protein
MKGFAGCRRLGNTAPKQCSECRHNDIYSLTAAHSSPTQTQRSGALTRTTKTLAVATECNKNVLSNLIQVKWGHDTYNIWAICKWQNRQATVKRITENIKIYVNVKLRHTNKTLRGTSSANSNRQHLPWGDQRKVKLQGNLEYTNQNKCRQAYPPYGLYKTKCHLVSCPAT